MSLNVALQSVAFYVLSCSTCTKINHRRRAKSEARRERAEKQALEAEHPELYRHPSPFSTNQYWTEEILLGPGEPKKKGSMKNSCHRTFDNPGQDGSYAESTTLNSEATSTPTTVTEDFNKSGDGWNIQRYQREDEYLWGSDVLKPGQIIKEAMVKTRCTDRRLVESDLSIDSAAKEDSKNEKLPNYYVRNAPLNDLHPPIVSTASLTIAETRWMIQPPPSAKVMEGKERVNKSRASSISSSRKGLDNIPLSRQMVERMVDAKLSRGESPTQPEVH